MMVDSEVNEPCFSGSNDDFSADVLDDLPASGDAENRKLYIIKDI